MFFFVLAVISSFLCFFAENISEVNLIIEQGNTSSKVAIYNGSRIEASFVYKDFGMSVIAPLLEKYNLSHGILSSVIDTDEELITFLKSKLACFVFLDENTSLPITVRYETPETLGKDRLAAVVGANYLRPGKDILIIDAGTAITYELIEASGIYLGGNISPGMTTRFKALNTFTKKLPLVSETDNIPLLGTTTKTAIQAGVVNGIVYEMDGYIDRLRVKYPELLVFLTGGHSFYFERRLKNSIFADINLVLTGLNRILEYNVEN
ncbi:type III pantothenate kinase [Parabacteroides bouchesdurhonensis]|uniref:type III pantothenate kinase n=1 Tax=Parabacteroides bouchesdurhonensis TaxID=1936995 RepID=UPI000C8403D4|nr:type III pantothenate kinase [Parabacteroides bouchesdurhonensis]RHJ95334.1 type III pantothenate kinase [Bacteroides sp. AM07-16]